MRALFLPGHLSEAELLTWHPGFRVEVVGYEPLGPREYTKALLIPNSGA